MHKRVCKIKIFHLKHILITMNIIIILISLILANNHSASDIKSKEFMRISGR